MHVGSTRPDWIASVTGPQLSCVLFTVTLKDLEPYSEGNFASDDKSWLNTVSS